MVFFQPASVSNDDTPRVEPAARRTASDFVPLALDTADSVAPNLRALNQRETYTTRQTIPAAAPTTPPAGAVWRAGLLEELLNPKPHGELATRVLCADTDREAWLRHRRTGITATDAARLATPASVRAVANDKLYGGSFTGNAYTEYGKQREPEIQKWVREQFGINPCGLLIRAAENHRHLATPDGFAQRGSETVLAEIKTTNKSWSRIPRNYLRQVYWQQYVVGAARTLFVWETHHNFVRQDAHPRSVWIERDDTQIARLVALADQVLERLALD